MRLTVAFLVLAIVLFLIPPLLALLNETVQMRTIIVCFGIGAASFVAGHLPERLP